MSKVRALVEQEINGIRYPVDAVIDLPDETITALQGTVDPDAAAVAYAETLGVALPEGAPARHATR